MTSVHFISDTEGWAVGRQGGILKTTNGGTTWALQTSGTTGDFIDVYFVNATTGWTVGTGGIILKTTDGGSTWTPQVSGTIQNLSSVCFVSATEGWAVGGGGVILKTTNGGTNWTPQTSGTINYLLSVYFVNATTGWTVGSNGTIRKTTNGGTSWTSQTSGTPQYLSSACFIDATTGWAVGASGTILQTTNGGTNWTPQTSGTTQTLNAVHFSSATTGWAVGAGGTILQTTNGGTNWTPQASGTTRDLESVYFSSAATGWAVGYGGVILGTANSGVNWSLQKSGTTETLYSIYFHNANIGWAVGKSGTILKTTNGGTNWTQSSQVTYSPLLSVQFISENIGWASGGNESSKVVLKTTDGGTTWNTLTLPNEPYYGIPFKGVHFISENIGWIVGDLYEPAILKTTDGGATWALQTPPESANYLNAVHFNTENIGWVVGDQGKILKTTNGGTTWIPQTSGTTQHLNSIRFTSDTEGWAVGNGGTILKTTNGGTTWTPQTSGTTQHLNSARFISATEGWVAGNGGVILKTTNGGTTWTPQTSGTTQNIHSVYCTSATTGWAVGDEGTILLQIPLCPDLSTNTPAEVGITNSTCGPCGSGGGSITAPAGTPCPAGSDLQYQVDNGTWSSTLPTYAHKGPAQTIKTRCSCTANPATVSPESAGVTTVPANCPLDYSISTAGGNLVITDVAGNADMLVVTEDAGGIKFNVTNATRTCSIDGAASSCFPVTVPNLSSFTSATINAAGGADQVSITIFTNPIPNLAVNGGAGDLTFTGNITNNAASARSIALQSDANITLSQSASGSMPLNTTVTAAGNVLVNGSGYKTNGGTFSSNGLNINITNSGLKTERSGTAGGNITLTPTGTVTIQEGGIQTGGGHFSSSGTTVTISGSAINTARSGATGGNIEFTHSGNLNFLNGTIQTGGGYFASSGVDFTVGSTINTTSAIGVGGNITLTTTGNVLVPGSIYTGGGHFSSSGVNFTATNTSYLTTTYAGGVGGNIMLTHTGNVRIERILETGGGNFSCSGASFLNNLAGINTAFSGGVGGSFVLNITGAVTLGAYCNTGGGNFSSTGTDINLKSGFSTERPGFVGGNIQLTPTGNVLIEGISNTVRTGGGNFSCAGVDFTSESSVLTDRPGFAGGNFSLTATGNVTLQSYVGTFGGNFSSIGGVDLTIGGGIRAFTSGGAGTVNIQHSGVATIKQEIRTDGNISIAANRLALEAGIFSSNGNVLLNTPNGTSPTYHPSPYLPAEITAANLAFSAGSKLSIDLNGTTPGDGTGSTYTQLTVAGAVNLTGASLVFNGAYTPLQCQVFTLLLNDGTDPIIGTFAGLAEGTMIPNFRGSGANGKISYVGGTGNDVTITVQDNTPPTISCPTNKTANALNPPTCTSAVNGIDATFSDNCGATLAFAGTGVSTLSGSGNASGQVFNKGLTTVTYTATDGVGNTSTCAFTVTVNCDINFSGRIIWKQNNTSGVKDVTVALSGDQTASALTPLSGNYNFTVPPGTNFVLTPTKTLNKLNGVNAQDVTRIQQHLGANPFTDMYLLVAADVNSNGLISALDANIIQMALLGNASALAQMTKSWRFVPTAHVMANPPWGFPETLVLNGIGGNQVQDFYGIKVGDVASTYANPANGSGKPLVLRVPDQILTAGHPIEMIVSADALADLTALQFALQFDPEQLQLENISALDALPITADNFGTFDAAAGSLRFLWAGAGTPASLQHGAPMFRLRFQVLESGSRLSEVLRLDPETLDARVFGSRDAEAGVSLRFDASTAAAQPDQTASVQLLQNRPNPFVDNTRIGFVLPAACEAQLRIFDAAGRLVAERAGQYPAGRQEEAFDLPVAPGVLYYELTTPFGVVTKKMVRL